MTPREALGQIAQLRDAGHRRALVISATGTGKTYLAAFDVRAARPARMLFLAHREQLLDQAIASFHRVLGGADEDYGKVVGAQRDLEAQYVFATIQTLSKPEVLGSIHPEHFDYVLIDEVHRATADTYRRVIDHFSPGFLLGVTATPERSDGSSVFELFDYNVAYEIRLGDALREGMLAPFHYYGVADFTFEDGETVGDATQLVRLVSPERVRHLLDKLEIYGQAAVPPRGLIFVGRKAEASDIARQLDGATIRGRQVRAVALSGDDPVPERERQIARLERGELNYLVTVDVFNEGVDIPTVNQVVMLRQTESAIVFVQQLGRGLRKAPGKEYVVVLDFIGNYQKNYLVPIALFGDESRNAESVLRAVRQKPISGVSTVQFDRIAQERVLSAVTNRNLQNWKDLKAAVETIRNRVGRAPRLMDFVRFASVEPSVLATRLGSFPELLQKFLGVDHGLSLTQLKMLRMLGHEVLGAKRLHEATVLRALLRAGELSRERVAGVLRDAGLPATPFAVRSVVRTLSLAWNTEPERAKYVPAAQEWEGGLRLSEPFRASYRHGEGFRGHVDDLLEAAQHTIFAQYAFDAPFTRGEFYTRKDACRLLDWMNNSSSTVYGYRVDRETQTCPIFVTLHKDDEVAESTAYEDALLDQRHMRWFSKSNRTMQSNQERDIVEGRVAMHVFVKKDDAEGADHYYLGRASVVDAADTTIGGASPLPVVRMRLEFEEPIEQSLFAYFHSA